MIDIETTGLSKYRDEILEIGIVGVILPQEKIKPLFNQTIKPPTIGENCWIFENSSLNRELIEDSKTLDHYKKRLQNLFSKYPCVSYNTDFDFPFLQREGFQFKKILPDPMKFATNLLKLPSNGYGEYKWPKVQECLDFFNIQKKEPHRALEDAWLEALIILELIKIGYGQFRSNIMHYMM